MRRTAIALLLLLSACGGRSPAAPSPPVVTLPQIGGVYTVTWTYRGTQLTNNNQPFTLTCPGSVTVTQTAGVFDGAFSYEVGQDCDGRSSGQIGNGTVATDGTIGFDLRSTQTPDFIAASLGCTIGSGSTRLTGTIKDRTLDATTATVRLLCTPDNGGDVDVTLAVHGTR